MSFKGFWSALFLAEADSADPRDPSSDFWFTDVVSLRGHARVSTESAMRSSAVFACVRIISETLGSLPLILYRRLERGKERAPDHPLYKLLRYKPNSRQSAMEFFEMMTAHMTLRGNAYAHKLYDAVGNLQELIPLIPDNMQVDQLPNGRLGYLYTTPRTGTQYRYLEDEIFHLRGLTLDGIMGISVIGYAANAINIALAADDFGARFFENDATPGGVLKHPAHFADKERRDAFSAQWHKALQGRNRGKTAVLEDGMSFEPLAISQTDAQYIETKRFQIEDIGRIFRIPAILLGETSRNTSWGSGVEQFMISFLTHTMRPWFVRWEQRIQIDFLDDASPDDEYFSEFLIEAMLRGDTSARFTAYGSAIDKGWMTRNEARERENMNPIDGLDVPLSPLNMTPASSAEPGEAADSEDATDSNDQQTQNAEDPTSTSARQVGAKEIAAGRRALAGSMLNASWVRRFYGSHSSFVRMKLDVSAEFSEIYCAARSAELEDAITSGDPANVSALFDAWESDDGRELAAKVRRFR